MVASWKSLTLSPVILGKFSILTIHYIKLTMVPTTVLRVCSNSKKKLCIACMIYSYDKSSLNLDSCMVHLWFTYKGLVVTSAVGDYCFTIHPSHVFGVGDFSKCVHFILESQRHHSFHVADSVCHDRLTDV